VHPKNEGPTRRAKYSLAHAMKMQDMASPNEESIDLEMSATVEGIQERTTAMTMAMISKHAALVALPDGSAKRPYQKISNS
jgi:hypothetical protein